ncbi:MAG: NADPH-dependent glutamate synthase [Candidatus Aminicenantes bacterium]|nr:NADPH-dependent glutamate synthase [Candidatus Aminicenantes bacterium]
MIKLGGTRVPMREQKPEERIKNFKSVPLGYSEEEVIKEAQRCIQCKGLPCETECPINMKILEMIREIANRNFKRAFFIIKEDNPIPAITGRVCPQENQCEGVCPPYKRGHGINIGKLEAFVADWAREKGIKEEFHIKKTPEKVAVIGSGPAGISCAVDLRKFGFQVTMYEALHKAGGVLQYGIPAFRLPTEVVDYEIQYLDEIGVDIKLNFFVGQNIKFNELREEFDAIFLATGAGAPFFMDIEGESLKGVYSANEFLIRVNLMKAYKFLDFDTPIVCKGPVGIIGAGNVAMDAARCALRLGVEKVYILYRRTKKQSPARDEEIQHALEEGMLLKELISPKKFVGDEDGWLKEVELFQMELGEADKSGRPRPIKIEGSEFRLKMNTIVEALGSMPNRLFLSRAPELEVNKWGQIKVDHNLMTNIKGVYAGGDAIRGNATVILALGDGRKAAQSIRKYISSKSRS